MSDPQHNDPAPCGLCRKWAEPFICFSCAEPVERICLKCHSRIVHQGAYISKGIYCPHCGQLTKAPTYRMLRVFYLSEIENLKVSAIAAKIGCDPHTVRRLRKNVTDTCLWCAERLYPKAEELRILFLVGLMRTPIEQAARIASHWAGERISTYRIRAILLEAEGIYGIDKRALRSEAAFYRHLTKSYRPPAIGGTAEIEFYQEPRHARARHPLEGYVRDDEDKS